MAGVTAEDARRTQATAFYDDPRDRRKLLNELLAKGRVENREVALRRKNGTLLRGLVRMERVRFGQEELLMALVQDVTEQRQTERQLEGMVGLLRLFASKTSRKDYLQAAVKLLREWCDCRCVGIRLVDAEQRIPYAAQVGFSRRFRKAECGCSLATSGCACVRVLAGRPAPADKATTSARGSFFCNDTMLMRGSLGAGPDHCARTACAQAGYRSLAHAPIRHQGRLVGTIQVSDPRPERFPPEKIALSSRSPPCWGKRCAGSRSRNRSACLPTSRSCIGSWWTS